MNDKIRDLQKQIKDEEQRIKDCNHEFQEAFYNPETVKEGYGSKNIGKGSDPYFVPEGYRDVEKPRWTRICQRCGHNQHAYTKKPIVSGHEPDFG